MELNNMITLSIIGFVISGLLGVIMYFLKQLVLGAKELTTAVGELRTLIDNQKTACFEKHSYLNQLMTIIETNINGLLKKANDNEKAIEHIKGHLKIE